MVHKPKISPKLYELMDKGGKSEAVNLILADGRQVSCKFDCLTYSNTSDDDDTDVMVALVHYEEGQGELLAEEDIIEVL